MRPGVFLVVLAVSACSLTTDLSGLSGPDASVTDSAADVVADVATDVATDASDEAAADAEAGPFDANFYGNLELWLSADVGVTVGDAGSMVSRWMDRSAKARTVMTPASSVTCQQGPTLRPSTLHGLPVVTFDGYLNCMTVSGPFTDFSQGFTAFVVFQPQNCNSSFTGNAGAVFDSWDNASNTYNAGIAIARDPTPAQNPTGDAWLSIYDQGMDHDALIVGGGSWVPATPELLELRLPAGPTSALTTATAYVNGTLATLSPNAPFIPSYDTNRTTTYIGLSGNTGTEYPLFCGDLGELLVFSEALTDKDRKAVEAHLLGRWGL